MNTLGVESNESSPGYKTPRPANSISDETVNLLEEAAKKLKKGKSGSSKRNLDQKSQPSTSGANKKRKLDQTEQGEESSNRHGFPADSKPLYLKAKQLCIRKLHLATNVQHIKGQLKDGHFPAQISYKCQPPSRDSSEFSVKWTKAVSEHKRLLTELWIEELSRKYQVVKLDIRKCLENLKSVLNKEQFSEIKKTLDDRYKEAATKKVSKKVHGAQESQDRPIYKKGQKKPSNKRANQDKQMQKLLTGLSKLISKHN